MQVSGLYHSYVNDNNIRAKIKSLSALVFLPVSDVPNAYDELVESFPDELQDVASYFENTYVGRRMRTAYRRHQPRFKIPMWNITQRLANGLPRTNNSVESWHCAFQGSLQSKHLSLWKRIIAIRLENCLQQMVFAQAISGTRPLPKKSKYKRIKLALQTLLEQRDTMPLLDFLRGCSYNLEMNV